MTNALLHRARAMGDQAGVDVDVLLFDPACDLVATRELLEGRGLLGPRVRVRSMWAELADLPDEALRTRRRAKDPRMHRPGGIEDTATRRDGSRRTTVHDDDRALLWTDIHRPDGSLLATIAAPGQQAAGITAYDRAGVPVAAFRGPWALYRFWLDRVVGDAEPTYIVVDSKSLVSFFASYTRDNVWTIHVVHGSHLAADAVDAHGPLATHRRSMVENVDRFDAVVFLTDQQREDVVARVGERDTLVVIPNSSTVEIEATDVARDPHRGVMLASLTARKAVGDAIKATVLAARTAPEPVRLDVYGGGSQRARLDALAAKHPGFITLHGHVPGAAAEFLGASFMLLTSVSEGLPLVFVEAMARGCIPIAYDIRYGPRDIVTDGVDGFVVPAKDVDAVADRIVRLQTMPAQEVEAMRAAARAKAAGYSDRAVVGRWADLLAEITERRLGRPRALSPVDRLRKGVTDLLRRATRLTASRLAAGRGQPSRSSGGR